jgi:hypothetical protein
MDKYGNTRKVAFTINDTEYLRKIWKADNSNVTDDEINSIFDLLTETKCTFILCGRDTTEDRYELFNANGEKMNINDLNSYQKGCIISECHAYFEGRNDKPFGVVDIKEEVI